MSPIEEILKKEIEDKGPVSISRFMELALYHPEHGYYIKGDPLGIKGDFITAPEISQIFGELIGLWCIGIWRQMQRPTKFNLVEFGPGRGTLMADLIRSVKTDHDFMRGLRIHMIEISPALQECQKTLLNKEDLSIQWHKDLSPVPQIPTIFIGNEFLDALPMDQYTRDSEGRWCERKIGLSFEKELEFFNAELPTPEAERVIPQRFLQSDHLHTFEVNTRAQHIIGEVSKRLAIPGAALFIDYGSEKQDGANTLQALYKHTKCNVLDHIGKADITAHVDFEALIKSSYAVTPFLTTQGDFLRSLGIDLRSNLLIEQNPLRKNEILGATHRLTDPSEMGELFKVLVLTNPSLTIPKGF